MKFAVSSLEYVKVPVAAVINGVAYDPHGDVVKMTFPPRRVNPLAGDWKSASWESNGAGGWLARCLVGTGGRVALPVGAYDVWVQIIDAPEIPTRKVGLLDVA